MRIALVGNWPPPHGGLSVHVEALARVLRERGADVRVLDIGAGDHRGGVVRRARGPLRYALALARVAAEGRLVHLHTNGANRKSWLVALAAGRARRPGGPRAILTVHSGLCPAWLRASEEHRRLAARATAPFARVLAVNDDIAAALAEAGVPRERLAIVSPFSRAMVRPAEAPAPLAAFAAAHAPLFAAALAPGPVYGAEVLVRAFAAVRERLPDAGLVLFGPDTASDAGLQGPGVLVLGELAHGAALGAVGRADVFVRPTRADGDAVSVREALALGRAVVATRVGHRPDACLLVPPGDPAALAEAMLAAARRGPPAPDGARGVDAFDTLLALYATLRSPRPLPDGGRDPARAPTF